MPYVNIFSMPMQTADDLKFISNKIDYMVTSKPLLYEFLERNRFTFNQDYTKFINLYIKKLKPGFNDFSFMQALSYFLYFCTPNQEQAIINNYIKVIHSNTTNLTQQNLYSIIDIFADMGNLHTALAIIKLYEPEGYQNSATFLETMCNNPVYVLFCKIFPKQLQNYSDNPHLFELEQTHTFDLYSINNKSLNYTKNLADCYIYNLSLTLKNIVTTINLPNLYFPKSTFYYVLYMRLFAIFRLKTELTNEINEMINTITYEAYSLNTPFESKFQSIINKCYELIGSELTNNFALTLIAIAKSPQLKLYYYQLHVRNIDGYDAQLELAKEELTFYYNQSAKINNNDEEKRILASIVSDIEGRIKENFKNFYDNFTPDNYDELSIKREEISIDL